MIKKIISNYRYYVLLVVGFAMIIGICSAPEELNLLWLSKAVGIAMAWVFYTLIDRWDRGGKIPELSKLAGEEE